MNMNQPTHCEGNCIETHGQHKGNVIAVTVDTWGIFNYCKNAIEEDTNRGLTVTPIPSPTPQGKAITVEAAAAEYAKNQYGNYESTSLEGRVKISTSKTAFIAGAKWQASQKD